MNTGPDTDEPSIPHRDDEGISLPEKEGGWLKLWRCLRDNPMWEEMPYSTGKLWLWLLMEATHEGQPRRLKHLRPGQMSHSVDFICEALEWEHPETHKTVRPSDNTVRKGLLRLVAEGMITWERGGGGGSYGGGAGRITICAWEKYQAKEGEGCGTVSGTVSGTQSGQLKNIKKGEEKEKTLSPQAAPGGETALKRRRTKLRTSPHYPFLVALCRWFHANNPHAADAASMTEAAQVGVLEKLENLLRLNMADAPDCETRLWRIVHFAANDTSFWQRNLLSLGALREKNSGGIFKFKNIEAKILPHIKTPPMPTLEEVHHG